MLEFLNGAGLENLSCKKYPPFSIKETKSVIKSYRDLFPEAPNEVKEMDVEQKAMRKAHKIMCRIFSASFPYHKIENVEYYYRNYDYFTFYIRNFKEENDKLLSYNVTYDHNKVFYDTTQCSFFSIIHVKDEKYLKQTEEVYPYLFTTTYEEGDIEGTTIALFGLPNIKNYYLSNLYVNLSHKLVFNLLKDGFK